MCAADSKRPSWGWYAICLAVCFGGTAAAGMFGWSAYEDFRKSFIDQENVIELVIPGTHTVHIAKPGSYTLWNDYQTVHGGTVYSSTKALPSGFTIRMNPAGSEEALAFESAGSARIQAGGHERVSLFSVEIPRAGDYTLHAEGQGQPRVLSLRPAIPISDLLGAMGKAAAAVSLLAIAWLLAPIGALLVYAQRAGAARGESAEMEPSVEPSVERRRAMYAHLSALLGCVIPLGTLFGPVLVYAVYSSRSELVAAQAKESINFQLTMLLAALLCIPLIVIVIGIFLLIGVSLLSLGMPIYAGVRANETGEFQYPFTLRLLK